MQTHMETLMKLVEESRTAHPHKSSQDLLSVKLVPLTEKDDIEAYLVTFERIMVAHKIDKTRWPHHLGPQLTGRAQLAFAALPTANSDDYEAIKTAVLTRYDINEEAIRRRFRTTSRMEGETNRELAIRMMDLQTKWLRECSTVEEVHEVVGIEQFLNTLKPEKRLWVMERKPKTCVKAGELADEYELARQQEPRVERTEFKKTPQDQRKCHFCGKLGPISRETAERRKVLKVLMVLWCVLTVRSMDTPHGIALRRMHFIGVI